MTSISRRFLVLGWVGIIFSAILLEQHVRVNHNLGSGPSACAISASFNCDLVARSPYSSLFGVPLAAFGLLFYALLALIAGAPARAGLDGVDPEIRSRRSGYFILLSIVGVAFAGYYGWVSWMIVKTLCLYCSVLYLTNALLAILAWVLRDKSSPLLAQIGGALAGALNLPFLLVGLGDASPFERSVLRRGAAAFLLLGASAALFGPAYIYHYKKAEAAPIVAAKLLEPPKPEIAKILSGWQPLPSLSDLSLLPLQFELLDGDESAPITIYEFSDFECPFCRMVSPVFHKIVKGYAPYVKFIFKNFPLDISCNTQLSGPIHEQACSSAYAALCALPKGREAFWKMHKGIFDLTSHDEGSLVALAEEQGFDKATFATCLIKNEDVRLRVRRDLEVGRRFQIHGTPSVLLVYGNRYLTISPKELELLPAVLDQILQAHTAMNQTGVRLP